MACKHMYYKEDETYYPRLYCKINNKYCIYAKRCENKQKYIPNDDLWKECYIMIQEEQKNIPIGSKYVQLSRPNKKGNLYLYVVINDKVEKISTQLKSINQNYVYIKEGLDGKYEVSLTPFTTERKQPYQKKTYQKSNKKN